MHPDEITGASFAEMRARAYERFAQENPELARLGSSHPDHDMVLELYMSNPEGISSKMATRRQFRGMEQSPGQRTELEAMRRFKDEENERFLAPFIDRRMSEQSPEIHRIGPQHPLYDRRRDLARSSVITRQLDRR